MSDFSNNSVTNQDTSSQIQNQEIEQLYQEIENLRMVNQIQEQQILQVSENMGTMILELEEQRNALKKSETQEKILNKFIENVLNNMNSLLVILAPNGTIQQVNQKLIDELGFAEKDILGNSIDLLITPSEIASLKSQLPELAWPIHSVLFETIRLKKKYIGEHTFVCKNLKDPPGIHLLQGSLVYDHRGILQGAVLNASDITSLRSREKALAESEERFRLTTQTAYDAIVIIDHHDHITFWNNAAASMFGYTADEIMGKKLHAHLVPEEYQEAFRKGFAKFHQTGTGAMIGTSRELEALQKNGSRFSVEVSLSAVRVKNQWHAIGFIRDISERKQHEAELMKAKIDAEAASQAKSHFLANMSHEIRTPLNSIVGFSQILLTHQDHEKLPNVFKDYLQNIKTAGNNLLQLINNILDLSKIEAGKMGLSEETLNFKQLFEGIYHVNKAAATEKRLKYLYELDPELPEYIQSDRSKLNQILMNLVSNAIKFTPAGKKLVLKANKEGAMLFLQVIDEGIGISQEQQLRIFDAFEQADGSTTRQYGGTGLGLAITKKMVDMLGGRIALESQLEQGSRFSIWLPLKITNLPITDERPETYLFSKDNVILVIEDNPMNQLMVSAMFEGLGLAIKIANDGLEGVQEALNLKKAGRLDLILMDMHMPKMDGMAAAQKIWQHMECRDIPIVALSADAFKEQQESALKIGISDYLTKPIDQDKLLPLLAKYLRQENAKSTPAHPIANPSEPVDPNNHEPKPSSDFSLLPETVQQQLHRGTEKLAELPIYYVDEIVEQTEKMLGLCEEFNASSDHSNGELHHLSQTLNAVIEAAYQGNEETFSVLITKLKNKLP